MFGVLMIIHIYATGAGALVKFQTWQFIVRYGAPALQRGDKAYARDFDPLRLWARHRQRRWSAWWSRWSALPLLADVSIFAGRTLPLALIYCTLVPTMSAATAVGVLRLLDRFDLIGVQQIVTPILRAVGASIAYFGHLGFVGFVATWYIADLGGDLVLWGNGGARVEAARHARRLQARPVRRRAATAQGVELRLDDQYRPFDLGRLGAALAT